MTEDSSSIWLIGGTQESRVLATAIAALGLPCLVSVTTQNACGLYSENPDLKLYIGQLRQEDIESFLRTYRIGRILDASHPYAVEISQLAIAVSEQFQIPYLRYERPVVSGILGDSETTLRLDSFSTLLAGNYLSQQRVLLTTGYKSLSLFQSWQVKATLFARILPSPVALEAALAAGFTADRLIALRPPLSLELERALWQHWQISLVVTKASGTPGGEGIKQQLAAELKIPLVIIDRPAISYPQQTSCFEQALEFCRTS